MILNINKSEFSFITVMLLWIIRMTLPGVTYVFIPTFILLTFFFFIQYKNIYWSKHFVMEFIKAFTPLLILSLFYFVGIAITGKFYIYNIKDIGELIILLLFLFYYFILIHRRKKQESFYIIFKSILLLFGITSLLIALFGLLNFYLELYHTPLIADTPFGTSIEYNKNFYALFSVIGIISFIPKLNSKIKFWECLISQIIISILILNVLLSFSYESIFVLVLLFTALIVFQISSIIHKSKFHNLAKNSKGLLIISVIVFGLYSISSTSIAPKESYIFKHVRAYNHNIKQFNTDAFSIERLDFALRYYDKQPIVNKIFGGGFDYYEAFGERYRGSKKLLAYPNNPIISALLYSGILGALFTLLFFIISIYYAISYLKTYPSFSIILFVILVFTIFSISTIFSGPIFLIIFSLSFLIRYQEISDLIIDINIEKPTSKFLKENVDYIVSTIVFFVFSPVWIFVSLAILISNGRPILFSQLRVGQNGKLFRLYKFRSMKNVKSNTTVAAAETNRISKLGKFLRRSKIDELPELFNIMRGDMSFVGPRPDVPGYADSLTEEDREILKLKPGLTGPASLKYYDEEELLAKQKDPQKYNDEVIFPDKVRINLLYMKNWTFWMDMRFILMTALKKPFEDEDVM